MTTRIATATRNAMAAAAAALVDAGSGPGTIEVRTGAQPATPADAATGTLLVTFTLNDPAYTGPTVGVMDLDVTPAIQANPVATGTAGWFRLKDSTGAAVLDGACGTSGAQLNLTTTALETGVQVSIASGTITQPGA